MQFKITVPAETFVKRAFWLLWKACGGPLGMGVLQDNPNATEEEVWENIKTSADYPGGPISNMWNGKFRADYVFGRMIKLTITIVSKDCIEIENKPYTIDYQGFCNEYLTPEDIVNAVNTSLEVDGILMNKKDD